MEYKSIFILIFLILMQSEAQWNNEELISKDGTSTPNIIIFLADDLGYGDLSYSGHPTSSTPALDDLAENGRFFTHFYVTSPVCSPSRSSILTGRYQVRSGTYPSTYVPANILGLPHNETTIAKLLKDKGYRTQMVGKWHLGVGVQHEFIPSNPAYGFDNFLGLPYSHDMCPCPICFPDNGTCFDNCWGEDFVSCALFDDTQIVEQPVYLPDLTGRLLERSVQFVTEAGDSGSPFFLYFAFHHIHHPQFASSDFYKKSPRGTTGDALLEMDSAVETIVDLLKQMDILNNTLIWFLSDNGPSLRRHERGGCAGLLRCGKGTTWEGGIRVPSIVYWENKIAPGRSNDLTSSLDILPTIASIVGLNTSNLTLDGVDLTELLLQENVESPREFFAVYSDSPAIETGPFAVIYKQYKAHFYTKGNDLSDADNYDPLCPGTHTLTKHDPPLLFNLYKDPGERYDLQGTDEYNDVIDLMIGWRDQHMQDMTWMEPRTLNSSDRAEPCCTNALCDPFPQCCDCTYQSNQTYYNFVNKYFDYFVF